MSVCFTSLYWSVTQWGCRKLVKLSVCRLTSLIFRNMEMYGGWSLFRGTQAQGNAGKKATDVQTEKERKEISHLLPSYHVGMIMRWAVRKGIICWKMSRFMIDRPGERYPLAFPCIFIAAARLLQEVCNLKCFVFTFWMYYLLCVEFIHLFKEAAVHDIIWWPLQCLKKFCTLKV